MTKTKVHSTVVKLDLQVLENIADSMHQKWQSKGDSKVGPERSYFLAWNRVKKFRDSLFKDQITVTGSYSDSTMRVYYTPSVTSLPRIARDAIIPINPKNHFLFCDLKAALS